jgi:hypothetical protein
MGFEMDAREYIVCSSAGTLFSRSAQPNPSSQIMDPSLATATAREGVENSTSFSRMSFRISSEESLRFVDPIGILTPIVASELPMI